MVTGEGFRSDGFRAGSLFSGIGGLDLAASWVGFDIRFQVEINDFCRKVLAKHASQYWPHARQYGDIRELTGLEMVDCLFGGFPCQDISLAGDRMGITADSRSGLWFEFARLIGELRPRCVLLENVPGIYTLGGTVVIGQLAAMGYDALWLPVRAADVGSPHQRERWFCLAYTSGQRRSEPQTGNATSDKERNDSPRQREWRSELHAVEPGGAASERAMAQSERPRSSSVGVSQRRMERYRTGSASSSDRKAQSRERQPQSGVCRNSHGLPAGLDFAGAGWRGWPAPPGQPQFDYEPPRTVVGKVDDRRKRLEALGNSVVPQIAYPLFLAIQEWLSRAEGFPPEDT